MPQAAELVSASIPLIPFHQFLCKIYTKCNLNCSYCYVYHHADQSWRTKPVLMSQAVVDQLAFRIREHVIKFEMPDVDIVLHGGEPLLAGVEFISQFTRTLKEKLEPLTIVNIGIQSNGTLLTTSILNFLEQERISVGVSLDGDKKVNDLYRLNHAGHSSYLATVKSVELLQSRGLLAGLLSTICLDADPVSTYKHLAQFHPPEIDFGLPLGHYERLPPAKYPPFDQTPYADWLISIFDVWFAEKPQRVRIRMFEDIMALLLGGRSCVESIGIAPVDFIVIETDGTLEAVDTLKVVANGAPELGLNIFAHSFEEAMKHPIVRSRQLGLAGLSEICQNCVVREICGGGYLPTRYRKDTEFRNPSVFCADYYKLIRHIRSQVINTLRQTGIQLDLDELPSQLCV